MGEGKSPLAKIVVRWIGKDTTHTEHFSISVSKETIMRQGEHPSTRGALPQPPDCILFSIMRILVDELSLEENKKSQDLESDPVLSLLGQQHPPAHIETQPSKCRLHSSLND